MTRIAPALLPALLPVLAVAGAALSVSAAAQSTRAAALAQLRAEFAATDFNHDGAITRPEAEARFDRMKMAGATHALSPAQAKQLTDLWFRSTDANHDGRVTLEEAESMTGQLFDRYDTNHDGVISPAERSAARTQLRAPATKAR